MAETHQEHTDVPSATHVRCHDRQDTDTRLVRHQRADDIQAADDDRLSEFGQQGGGEGRRKRSGKCFC